MGKVTHPRRRWAKRKTKATTAFKQTCTNLAQSVIFILLCSQPLLEVLLQIPKRCC
jgi:hypothetical protein